MNLKITLLASAAALFAFSANAADITNPFYLPTKGKVLSETSVAQSAAKYKSSAFEDHDKGRVAVEQLTLGVADNFAVYGAIANDFMWGHHGYNNDHNFSYMLGAKYNMHFSF